MVTRLSARLPATLLLFALACGERSISGSPPPNIPGKPLGMLIGTVSGDSFRATFVPAAGDVRRASAVSAAIYGGPTTANVFGTILAGYPKNVGGKHTWIFNVAMRNLLSYAIGSNFGATVPPDTGGVFLFFTQLPVVVFPNPCTGCVVNVTSQSGTRNFTNPGQPYFWYHDRPTAMQGTIGTDTTSDVQWTFQAATFTPPDTAHTFNFVLLVNAMWPPPNETAWQVRYDGTQDSVPDAHGKPLWTKFTFQHGLGQDKWTTSGLEVSAGNGSKDINYSRIDSLGNMSAFMDVIVNVDNGDDVTPIAMFGFAEPTGGKAAVVTVTIDTAKFAQIDNTTGVWTTLTGSGVTPVIGTNTYRLRKFGQDSAVLCVNGARALAMPYASLETTGSILAPMSAFFGLQGVKGKGHATYTLLTYTIGSDGGACF